MSESGGSRGSDKLTQAEFNQAITVAAAKAYVETEYVVLRLTDRADQWIEVARQSARDGNAAIKAALDGSTDGGTYLAIPARSFKPVKVTPKTETTLVLEEVKP